MKMYFKSILFFCLSVLFFYSCTNPQKKNNLENLKKVDNPKSADHFQNTDNTTFIVDTLFDDYASLLSGLPTQRYFKGFYSDTSYKHLQKQLEREWQLVYRRKIHPIRTWADSTAHINIDEPSIFYPFSGADFLYLDAFFRNHRQATLVGLEPLGTMIQDTSGRVNVVSHIEKVFKSLYFSNQIGFFRTNSMKEELNQKELNGALPLLFFYIKRSGYSIASLDYFNLDSKGNQLVADPKNSIGILIRYHNFKGEIKKLNYFSFDLSDQNLAKDDRLMQFVGSEKSYGVFLKAASYLMHGPDFSSIRKNLLSHANFILQDDSGIPFARFDKKDWNVELWGKYTETISLFKNKFQPGLSNAYKETQTSKLPFMIGYNTKNGECNLQWITRKK